MSQEPPTQGPDEVLAELAAVRRFRSPGAAALGGGLALLATCALVILADGWRYWHRSDRPEPLGRVEDAVAQGRLRPNRYVTFTGLPLPGSDIQLKHPEREPGCVPGPGTSATLQLLGGTGDRLVVQTLRPPSDEAVPSRTRYTGRIVRFADLTGRHRTYRRFMYRLTDCRAQPEQCDSRLALGVDLHLPDLLASLGKANAMVKATAGHEISCCRRTPLFVTFRHPGEQEYELRSQAKAQAIARVRALKVPWYLVNTDGEDHLFVLHAPAAVAERLVREHRKGTDYAISDRVSAYIARFGDLRHERGDLVIQNVRRGFPEDLVPAPEGRETERGTLVAVPRTGVIRVPLSRVKGISYQGPRNVPDDAWLLVEGLAPSRARGVAALSFGMLLLGLGGLGLIGWGLRPARRR
jgi:hypothetical protein